MKIFRKERFSNGRRNFLFCGIKIFSYFSRRSLNFYEPIIKKHDSFLIHTKIVKTIILGSSIARDGFNPDPESFNFGESSQDLYRSYMLYKWCINKSSVIKNVILFVDLWSPGFDLEKSSGESFKCIQYKYLFNIPYRSGWCDEKLDSFVGHYINKVINTKADNNYYGKSLRNMCYKEVLPTTELVAKQIHYNQKATQCEFVKDFIKLAKEHKHKLYIVFAPYRSDYLNCILDINRFYKWVYDLTKKTDVKVLNFLADKDFNDNDFEDTRHLNENGAMKLTKKINASIEEKFC